jgi:ubiquinol-cytochrome c reductase iron-sulfur subunit
MLTRLNARQSLRALPAGVRMLRTTPSPLGMLTTNMPSGGTAMVDPDKFVTGESVAEHQNRIRHDNNGFRTHNYAVIGGARFIGASIGRLVAVKFLAQMNPSADVLALANLEVDISNVQPGAAIIVKWRGKPVFVRNRTDEEIAAANEVDLGELRDPQTDADRITPGKENLLVVLGVCTHLGCVPINGAGDYNGWFCPCHGSHYDTSGRIRKGPAPLNLEIPPYEFLDDSKLVIG